MFTLNQDIKFCSFSHYFEVKLINVQSLVFFTLTKEIE